jgi:tripartite-type tricarboxylate transporter receptor subunit TctC
MMTLWLRAILVGLTTLTACALAETPARAQLSGRPIKFIVPYAAGGLPDTVARVVGRRLQERLGQTVVIENRPGANGGIAINALVSSPADGHTFAVTDAAILSINPQVYSKLAYDPKSVAPVAFLAQAPLFLAIHQKVPVATIKEFVNSWNT